MTIYKITAFFDAFFDETLETSQKFQAFKSYTDRVLRRVSQLGASQLGYGGLPVPWPGGSRQAMDQPAFGLVGTAALYTRGLFLARRRSRAKRGRLEERQLSLLSSSRELSLEQEPPKNSLVGAGALVSFCIGTKRTGPAAYLIIGILCQFFSRD